MKRHDDPFDHAFEKASRTVQPATTLSSVVQSVGFVMCVVIFGLLAYASVPYFTYFIGKHW